MKSPTTNVPSGEHRDASRSGRRIARRSGGNSSRSTADDASPNGATVERHPTDSLPLAPPRSVRSRAPQAILAALLIVGGGLGGLLLFSRYNQRIPAVVIAEGIQHGEVITREDLAVAEVALGGDVSTIASLSDVEGRFAAHDLEPGDLVSPADLATEDQLIDSEESVIGLLLEPGQYPTRRMAPGDRIDVFAPRADAAGGSGGIGGDAVGVSRSTVEGEALASDLVIFDVVESSSDGRTLLVSLVVNDQQAAAVFDASEGDGVRLALRGRE